MPISPARRAAFEILQRVEAEDAYSSNLLAAASDLNRKDRALCHELVLGVLRRRLWIDRALEHFAARPIEKLDLPVALALRLGLYQLRFLSRVPASAVVNDSVNLVRSARLKSAASFVNAVLRRADREPEHDPAAEINAGAEKLAVETSHPVWLIERWLSQFGDAETAAFAQSNNDAAPLAFRLTNQSLNSEKDIIAELRQGGLDLRPSALAPGAWRSAAASDLMRRLADQGLIYFQDEASQLIAHLVARQAGERVLDVCAAPGSKSSLIGALKRTSLIVAGDIHEHRVRAMKESIARQQNPNVQTVVYDATQPLPLSGHSFDVVLVDAPCSGTGTLRHNPEIRWRLRPTDIDELSAKQKLILENSARMVRQGGLLIYSTCSVETEENEDVMNHFLGSHTNFTRVSLNAPRELITENGTVRTWPHRDDVDGFFAAGFQRAV
jgi:16S rRNA (cytosine967-C5)-methyltransferase